MKFSSVKALVLSLAFLGLSSQSVLADDGAIHVDLPWVNEQVDKVCPKTPSQKSCEDEVQACREVSVDLLYKKIQLEQCVHSKGFEFICDSTQIKAVFNYVEGILQGSGLGHPPAVDLAKKCVTSTFPDGIPPKGEKPETFPLNGKEIIGQYCEISAGADKPACQLAAKDCQSTAEIAFDEVLTKVITDHPKDCDIVQNPQGDHYNCTQVGIDLVVDGVAERNSKENFAKNMVPVCTNLQVGDGTGGDFPAPPPYPGVGADDNGQAANNDTDATTKMGGWSCTMNASTPMAHGDYGMALLSLAAMIALHLGKRKRI